MPQWLSWSCLGDHKLTRTFCNQQYTYMWYVTGYQVRPNFTHTYTHITHLIHTLVCPHVRVCTRIQALCTCTCVCTHKACTNAVYAYMRFSLPHYGRRINGCRWGSAGVWKARNAGRMPLLDRCSHSLGSPIQNLTLLRFRTVKFSWFYFVSQGFIQKYVKICTIWKFPIIW